MLCTVDGKWNAGASASCLALRGQDRRLSAPQAESQVDEWSGLTAWVSAGGIRQGVASRQMPNPAETRRNW